MTVIKDNELRPALKAWLRWEVERELASRDARASSREAVITSLRLACAAASALKAVQQPEDLLERQLDWRLIASKTGSKRSGIVGPFARAGRGLHLRLALALQLVRKGAFVLRTSGSNGFLTKVRWFLDRELRGSVRRVRLGIARRALGLIKGKSVV